jgi:hypothetical protein
MEIYFSNENATKVTGDAKGGKTVGGFIVPPSIAIEKLSGDSVDWDKIPEQEVQVNSLVPGNIVGLGTDSFGQFEGPFVVADINNPTEEQQEMSMEEQEDSKELYKAVRLEYCGDRDITDTVILNKKSEYSSFLAGYYDYTYKNGAGRFVVGDGFSTYYIPDIHIAYSFGETVVEKVLPELL